MEVWKVDFVHRFGLLDLVGQMIENETHGEPRVKRHGIFQHIQTISAGQIFWKHKGVEIVFGTKIHRLSQQI